MKYIRIKIFFALFFLVVIMFFSNDFGIIDIEKTAIVTAVAIDFDNENLYEVTCEIAVPEATDTNSENLKTEVSASGYTVGKAIKEIGEKTGWYPQLYFCNLIIIGNDLAESNTIYILDYFAKTLRVQDSAQVVLATQKAKDLLKDSTPLDNISSFAIQKILLKNQGFDGDVASTNIKSFSNDYYGRTSSSYMPIIKTENVGDGNEKESQSINTSITGQSSSESKQDKKTFTASQTALFVKGKKVGELNNNQTLCFNLFNKDLAGTSFTVSAIENEKQTNYLLTIEKCKSKINLKIENNQAKLEISVKLIVNLVDKNNENFSPSYKENKIDKKIIEVATQKIYTILGEIVQISKDTNCDFLKIDNLLYRYNYKYYNTFSENLLQNVIPSIKIEISGQK